MTVQPETTRAIVGEAQHAEASSRLYIVADFKTGHMPDPGAPICDAPSD
jgi:hypothetical protein